MLLSIRRPTSSPSTTWASTPHRRTKDDPTDPHQPLRAPVPVRPHRCRGDNDFCVVKQ
jgi:hypothetical protein